MKLLRYGAPGLEKPGLIHGDSIRDLSGVIPDLDGSTLTPSRLAELAALDPTSLAKVEGSPRLGACVARPGKFICIGLNYVDHAAETGAPLPAEPVVFLKATSAVCGPNDPICKPRGSTKLDWEVELAFTIGRECRYVDETEGAAAIAGYFMMSPSGRFRWSEAANGTREKVAIPSARSARGWSLQMSYQTVTTSASGWM
jgi:2,4-didehydro-3-deoxy-L-rhamnonate hydrolase